jgi:hypothetical protein
MKLFISPNYFDLLTRHGLNTFEGFWDLARNWVEDPNARRRGWSGVIRHTIVDGEEGSFSMFVKLQENHNYRSPLHMLRWRPTLSRDFLNIRRLEGIGVPTVEPVFYAERRNGDKLQAVLATVSLDGYRELNSIFKDSSVNSPIRHSILQYLAEAVWLIHFHRLQHNSLSGRHVMIKLKENATFDMRILDHEKMRKSWSWLRTAVCDLEKFIRFTPALTTAEHTELVRHYSRHLSPAHRTKLAGMINEHIARRWVVKDVEAPIIHLGDSDNTSEQQGGPLPPMWYFLYPPLFRFSLRRSTIFSTHLSSHKRSSSGR